MNELTEVLDVLTPRQSPEKLINTDISPRVTLTNPDILARVREREASS